MTDRQIIWFAVVGAVIAVGGGSALVVHRARPAAPPAPVFAAPVPVLGSLAPPDPPTIYLEGSPPRPVAPDPWAFTRPKEPAPASPAPWWDAPGLYEECQPEHAEILLLATFEACGVGDLLDWELPLRRTWPGDTRPGGTPSFGRLSIGCMHNDAGRDVVGGGCTGRLEVRDTPGPGVTLDLSMHWQIGGVSEGQVDKPVTIAVGRADAYSMTPESRLNVRFGQPRR